MNIKKVTSFLLLFIIVQTGIAATRTSAASGDWTMASSWDCNCVPASTDDAIVLNGHTITVSTNPVSITNFTVNQGGTLSSNNNKNLTVTGNVIINGTYSGGNNIGTFLDWTGSGVTLDGIGTVSVYGGIQSSIGNKTILSSTSINLTTSFNIVGAVSVTNNGSLSIGGALTGTVAGSTWINGTNSTTNLAGAVLTTGTLTATASGNTINYNLAGNQSIKSTTYHHLSISGTGTKSLLGAVVLNGNLNISSGTLDVTASNFSITIGGNWSNSGIFTTQSGTVTFNGSTDQSIFQSSTATFYNLTVSKGSGEIPLLVNVGVTNTLTMSGGDISTDSYKIILGTSTTVTGTLTHTSGAVVGTFERWVSTGMAGTGVIFPVGNDANDRKATPTFNTITTGGSVLAQFVETSPGNSGFPLVDGAVTIYNPFVEGYWSLSASNGFVASNITLELIGNGFTTFSINASTRLLTRTNAGSSWTANGTHVSASGSIANRSGISVIGHYCFGDTTACDGPVTSAISGDNDVCVNESGVAYSVTNTPGSTYTWTITGGIQATGGTTNSITVNWGATGMSNANVRCVEYNGCSYGSPVDFTVSIAPIAPSSISGSNYVPENSNGLAYSVTAITGYTYTWVITGGTLASGQGTSAITVNWSGAGSGQVEVTASNGCGSASPVTLSVTKYVIINTVGTGNWNATTTWDCSCIPGATDNVRIKSTHTVTLDANRSVNSVVVETGGTFADNAKNLTITGNFTISGNYTGTRDLTLSGSNITIDGTGSIATSGVFTLSGGSKTISSGSTITRSPGSIAIASGISITNNGNITVAADITGGNAASTWINGSSSVLNVGGALLTTGTLTATSTGNTVNYNGTIGQNVKSTDYYNVSTTGASTTTLQSNLDANGNMNITGALNANNFNINVAGNWTNTGTFTTGTGTVTFDGADQTITKTGGETFNKLVLSGTGTKTMGSNVTVNSDLTINSTFDVSVSNFGLTVKGNWINNGTFTRRSGLVTLSGTSAQTISGATSLYDLTLNNAAGASISSGAQDLYGSLTLTAGTFTTSGQTFTLISNSSTTARIAPVVGGLTGNIVMQRYIAGGTTGWNFLSSPVTGTLASWQDDFPTAGYTGATGWAGGSFVSIYTYDETVTGLMANGYVAATNSTNAITPGKGYWAYVGTASGSTTDITVDVSGPPAIGAQSLSVTYTASGGPAEDGWNMVANPYPSTIDWDAGGWTKTNINNAIYIYNPDIGDYATYIGGAGVNGGSRYIASSQAFWVQSNGASPVLSTAESIKVVNNPAFLKTEAPSHQEQLLKISVFGNSKTDETIIRFIDSATNSFDNNLDAFKISRNNPGRPTIASKMDNIKYSINSIGFTPGIVNVPLLVKSTVSGNMSLGFSGIENFNGCITLEDLHTGTLTDLKSNDTYNYYHSDTTLGPRFLVIFNTPLEILINDNSCTESNDVSLIMNPVTQGTWSLEIRDQEGNLVSNNNSLVTQYSENNLTSGIYAIQFENTSDVCPVFMDTVEITETDPLMASFTIDNDTLYISKGGSISVNNISSASNGYFWDFGDGSTSEEINPSHQYNTPGEYEIKLFAINNDCLDSTTKIIQVLNDEVITSTLMTTSKEAISIHEFQGAITVEYNLLTETKISAEVYNVIGQKAGRDYSTVGKNGKFLIEKETTPGIYFIKIKAGEEERTFRTKVN